MKPSRGQAMVEMAFILPIAMIVLFVGIQFALLGSAALAVGKLAYTGARYASINPNLSDSAVVSWMRNNASPLIANSNSNILGINVSSAGSPRPYQSTVTVTVTLDPIGQKLILLPNPFFGIHFNTPIQSVQNEMVD